MPFGPYVADAKHRGESKGRILSILSILLTLPWLSGSPTPNDHARSSSQCFLPAQAQDKLPFPEEGADPTTKRMRPRPLGRRASACRFSGRGGGRGLGGEARAVCACARAAGGAREARGPGTWSGAGLVAWWFRLSVGPRVPSWRTRPVRCSWAPVSPSCPSRSCTWRCSSRYESLPFASPPPGAPCGRPSSSLAFSPTRCCSSAGLSFPPGATSTARRPPTACGRARAVAPPPSGEARSIPCSQLPPSPARGSPELWFFFPEVDLGRSPARAPQTYSFTPLKLAFTSFPAPNSGHEICWNLKLEGANILWPLFLFIFFATVTAAILSVPRF